MPVRQSSDGKYSLYYSTDRGDSNLTVGFYLVGSPELIRFKKIWDFGDGKIEKDLDLSKNHLYGPNSYGTCNGSVKITNMEETIVYGTTAFQIYVDRHSGPFNLNFYQTEGVIIANSYTGFSIAINPTPIDMRWRWGDGTPDDGPKPSNPNPNHQYKQAGIEAPFTGSVFLRGENDLSDTWNFSVMVLEDPTKATGWIEIHSLSRWGSQKAEVGKGVDLTAQLSTGVRNIPGHPYQYDWHFFKTAEHELEGHDERDVQRDLSNGGAACRCVFSSPGNYHVKCYLKEPSTGIDITLSTTLVVMDIIT